MQVNTLGKALRIATAVAVFGITASHAFAGAPMARTPAPGYYRFMLGNFEVTALSDGTVDLPVEQLLQEPAAKTVAALDKAFLKTPLQFRTTPISSIPESAWCWSTRVPAICLARRSES